MRNSIQGCGIPKSCFSTFSVICCCSDWVRCNLIDWLVDCLPGFHLCQERILKGEYGEGERFTYSYGLVFMNRFLGFLFSAAMLHYTRPKWLDCCAAYRSVTVWLPHTIPPHPTPPMSRHVVYSCSLAWIIMISVLGLLIMPPYRSTTGLSGKTIYCTVCRSVTVEWRHSTSCHLVWSCGVAENEIR